MNSQPTSPRRRLQELLAIPDNQRTEAQWDELNELEIRLAPGNREPAGGGGGDGGREGGGGGPGAPRQHPRNNGQGKRNPRKFHKRPKGNAA
jgi:hypothetical protein